MKILHVTTSYRNGGGERNIEHTIAWEVAQGHEVHIAFGADSTRDRFPASVPRHPIATLVRPVRPLTDMRAVAELRRIVAEHRFDLVHTHFSKAGAVARVAARGRVPLIVHTVHMPSFGPAYGRAGSEAFLRVERLCGRFTDLYAAVGTELVEQFVAAGVAPRERFRVVRSPIDLSRYADVRRAGADGRAAARIRLGVAPDARVAVALGSLDPRKRMDLVLERLHDTGITLLVAGAGPELPKLEERARANPHVRLLGYVDAPEDVFAAADVVVHASRVEGVPQVVVQALAAGRPVVATDSVGLREIPGAPIAIVDRAGVGLREAVMSALEKPPSPIGLDALADWAPDAVDAQIGAFHGELAERLNEKERAGYRGPR